MAYYKVLFRNYHNKPKEYHQILSQRGQKARLDSNRIFLCFLGKRLFAFDNDVNEFVLFIIRAHLLGLYQTWLHRADVNRISSSRSLPSGRPMSLRPTIVYVTITVRSLHLLFGFIRTCSGCIHVLRIFQSFCTMFKYKYIIYWILSCMWP
jgi:hypothetical protein